MNFNERITITITTTKKREKKINSNEIQIHSFRSIYIYCKSML